MRVDDAVAARWDRIKKELAPQAKLELKSPGVVDAMQLLQDMEREVERYPRMPKPLGHPVTPAMEARVAAAAMAAAEMVTLNVGGTCFATTRSNLLRFEGSYFSTMVESALWQPNARGEYFIDMEPTYFDRIVAYLRTGTLSFDGLASADVREFRRLLDYLQLSFVPTEWDPAYCGHSLQLQMHNLVVVQKGLGWSSVLATAPSPFFSVRVLAHHHVDIGFTTRAKFEPNKGHALHPGFFFGCERGYAYSAHEKKPFPKQRGKLIVTASFNQAAREVSFEVNGHMLVSPFRLVPTDAPLYPIVRLGERDASVEMTGGHWCEDV
ncbi:hypothetical protein SPRG_12871 [Saprolegnia parasitica CBS 223.65]|uniref:BTB domain-containing protein n=1 Tax=Saprolegnia parasitica (strain CBS 223.65) TaxID=695850 RepID=A0A067C510_SAPPC|nr:hypothetical protein SPRG_12871 [Saprolegnia parasitica CBS 223.65]KDO21631.1 hypothetical protein SPRG_12871 [Saprolegnia parasitica CBS 223.65]|eukprot:XP_012207643.1 hypothetical protein SPRG_12871 [Saprolegnia parasitica CBS 223.65]